MVVIAIMAVLAALAVPSFTPLVERWRVRQAVEGLQSTLYFARSEAIKRGGNVVVRKLPNNTNGCTSATGNGDWDCGWQVQACSSVSSSGTCANAQALQRFDAPANVQVARSETRAWIGFDRWGKANVAGFGFSIVPLNKNLSHPAARGLCASSGGRIRVIPPEEIPCTS